MPELNDLLERRASTYDPAPDLFDRVLDRRRRRDRNRRVQSALVALLVAGVVIGGLLRAFSSGSAPADDAAEPFLGEWTSTTDADGGTQRMTVRVAAEAVTVVVFDDMASLCSGAASTMTGTGRIEGETQLVIPAPVYTCYDGSEPEALTGPPLDEQLRDLTFVLDSQTDTLTDGVGRVWRRSGTRDPAEDPTAGAQPLWPQTSMEEVREAQDLADAGDPNYRWQVDHGLEFQVTQSHPDGAEIFTRFLEEELGWESFRWNEAFAHPDVVEGGAVVFIRCAAGQTNPLYPDDPDGCAPTIDDTRYETVMVQVAQPDRPGTHGIWVVTGWETIDPAEQVAPPTDAEVEASLGAFLQARVDGAGAERLVHLSDYDPFEDERVDREIPLLYATSTGAPYERSEFELVGGPLWPSGEMRFEARLFAGDTVVEQPFTLDRDRSGQPRVVYHFQPDDRFATTENGNAVPTEYGFLDGVVTYRAAAPFEPSQDGWDTTDDRTAVTGLQWHRRTLRVLLMIADPHPITPGCETAPAPNSAEALARSLRSDDDLDVTAPVPATIGGLPALQMDVLLRPGAPECSYSAPEISGMAPLLFNRTWISEDQLVRLYLVDLPEGSSAQVLAVALMAADVEGGLDAAAPIVDSIEIHAP